MRRVTPLLVGFVLASCGALQGTSAASDHELAQFRGVSLADFKRAQSELKTANPYEGREVGSCTLIKDDTGRITTTAIRQPPKVGS